jgi:hypothetical protein
MQRETSSAISNRFTTMEKLSSRLSTLDQIGKLLWRQMRRSIDPILVLDRVKGLSLAS